jgi:aspartyl protease family protein
MRDFIFFAIVALVVAVTAPRFIDQMGQRSRAADAPQAMTAQPNASAAPATAANGRLTVRPDNNGHFHIEGRVDGRRMEFVVDTGATVIAIPEREAALIGIHPSRRDYTAQIKTANGTILGAPTRLDMVEVGGLIVRNVTAVIMPDTALSENLLGMSFLSRLRRFEFGEGRLVLEQ